MGRRPPGGEAGDERGDPAPVDRADHLGPVGLAKEGEHGDDDQQRLQPFAKKDGEGAEEGRGGAALVGRQGALGLVEQGVDRRDPLAHLGGVPAAGDGGAKLGHGPLDPGHQPGVAGGEHRLDRLEAVEIGGKRQLGGALAVAFLISGEALARAARGRRRGRPPPGRLAASGLLLRIGDHRRRLFRPDRAARARPR